jgi:hypothetical protein
VKRSYAGSSQPGHVLRQQTATGHDHHTCELIRAGARDKIIETFADTSRGSRRQDLV